MYKNKKSRKYLNKRMRIKNKTKTMQKRLRKLKRGGNPEGDRPPPRPAPPPPPPFVLDNALVAQVQAEIARLNAVLVNLNNNNVQGARLFLGVIILYFTTVLANYRQSSDNIRGNQMVILLNQMLAQSQIVNAGITLDAMRLLSQQIGDNVLLANGDDDRYN
jgi:hypothetical protein